MMGESPLYNKKKMLMILKCKMGSNLLLHAEKEF
jgi:hypothetical protein